MNKTLNIGMVGCGEISLSNLKGIQNSGNSKVVIAMDKDPELAQSFAKQAGTKPTTDFNEVVMSENVDAVFICTPHHLHAHQGIQAAKQGKHVIVEKPLATTLEHGKELIKICRENNVKLSVPYVIRYNNNVIKAKELIQKEVIGKTIAMEIHWISDKPETYWEGGFTGRSKSDWRTSKDMSGGGILIMNCIHFFDIIDFITGLTPVKYSCQYDTLLTSAEVEDYFFGTLRYNNGAICSILASSKMIGQRYSEEYRGVRFFGECGQIIINHPDILMVYTQNNTKGIKQNIWNEFHMPTGKQDYKSHPRALFVKEFAQAVLQEKDPPITGEAAYRSLETCIKLYESDKKI